MKRLWLAFGIVVLVSFSVLGWVGTRIYQEQPPIPDQVVTTDGQVVIPGGDIGKGQNVWQAMGGMEVGSIWGHGSYVAPDWSADWLHRECVFILNDWATATYRKEYDQIEPEQQAQLQKRLERLMRTNTFDPATQTITVDPVRARAFESNLRHYADVFGNGNTNYAIPKGAQSDPDKLRQLAAFFFWTSWAASTNRPGADLSYTSNWPHEPLVSNRPDRRGRGLDRRERHHAARRDRSDGLVVRLANAGTPHGAGSRSRSHRWLEGHAVTASHGQVFLGRGGNDPRANPARRRHRSLRGRGRRLLRHSSLEVASLQRDSDVAPATRRACGLRRRGSPLGCSSGRWSADRNRGASGSASTSCSWPCWWSWSGRWPVSG